VLSRILSSCCSAYPYLLSFPTRRSSDLTCRFRYALAFRQRNGGAFLSAAGAGGGVGAPVRAGGRFAAHPAQPAAGQAVRGRRLRSEEHTSELQSRFDVGCRLLLEKGHRI